MWRFGDSLVFELASRSEAQRRSNFLDKLREAKRSAYLLL